MKTLHRTILLFVVIFSVSCRTSGSDGDHDADRSIDGGDGDADSDGDGDGDADGDGDGDGDEEGLLVWTLDAIEVARATGAEADRTFLYLPYWGRNVQVYFGDSGSLETGTYDCDDFTSGSVTFSLVTSDNSWSNLDGLPERWKTLVFSNCVPMDSSDTLDAWIRFDEVGDHLRGEIQATIAGAGERDGETLVIDGTFDIDVP